MLYLGAGMREVHVEGPRPLCVFPDFSDSNTFYYLPNFPHVATMDDGTPAIRMVLFREDLDTLADGDPDAVAFLSLDVDLGWPGEVIEQAASRLRIDDQLAQKPRLVPIFFTRGSVKLMLLDAQSEDETPGSGSAGAGKPTRFVTQIMGADSPELYGSNRAIFQATLSKKGAAAVSGALDGVTPIGVVYSLTFAGLQPAFNVKAHVDWQKVMDHWSERENLDLLFYESDIQKSIDKFVEDKVIDIEVTVEGVGADAMDADREAVMNSVRQLIFDKFFEATFKRETAAGDGVADDIVGTLTHIHQNALTLGAGFTYRRKEMHVEELRTLDLDWSARRASERTIYPQAHMHALVSEAGLTAERLVTVVDGADGLWKVQPMQVLAAAAWEADGIAGITVDIEYDDADAGTTHALSVFLDKVHAQATRHDWMDRTSGNRLRYKYEVVFMDGVVPGPRPMVDSGPHWLPHEGTVLTINPRQLYELIDLEVATPSNFAFERWPAVQASLRFRADDGSFEHHHDGVLSTANKTVKTSLRVDRGMAGHAELQLHYIGASGERVLTPWLPMQALWVVEDPHPNVLTVRAVVAGDRANIANLLVDLEYEDEEHGIFENSTLAFAPDTIGQPQSWTVHLADPTRRRYRYRMTLVTKGGDFLQTGWIGTDAPSLPVGEVYVRRLWVEMATGDLGPGVEAVEVSLVYLDEVNGVHDERRFRLGPRARAEWQLPIKDASQRAYQVTTTWIREDGFNPRVGPVMSSDSFLAIPGSPPQ